jgi:hypothetical protein
MSFTNVSPECRTCRWAYAKLYGLGWNHYQQTVQNTTIPRRLCVDDTTHMASQPFQESWGTSVAPMAASGTCKSLTTETTVGNLRRTLIQHDGVVDVLITSVSEDAAAEDIVLRLQADVRNSESSYFPHTHSLVPTIRGALYSSATIQDEKTRMTVVANWATATINSPQEGLTEIIVQRAGSSIRKDETRRIRVITEDTHNVHDKMTEFYPSSYGKRMVKDFVDPLDSFYPQA